MQISYIDWTGDLQRPGIGGMSETKDELQIQKLEEQLEDIRALIEEEMNQGI